MIDEQPVFQHGAADRLFHLRRTPEIPFLAGELIHCKQCSVMIAVRNQIHFSELISVTFPDGPVHNVSDLLSPADQQIGPRMIQQEFLFQLRHPAPD